MLDVRNLGIDFGGIRAVHGLDLTVEGGEICGLIGPNGAGKTTAFNLVTGIYRPSAGSISVGGTDITGKRPHEVTRHGVARTFQNIRLFRNLPVLHNVLVAFHVHARYGLATAALRGRRYDAEERRLEGSARELLELMGLGSRADDLAGNLSYGDQRRLEIARALATGPKLLLLDEPAAGMNRQERTKLMELIRFVRDRLSLAILLIEHDMRVVMGTCERVTVLDHGEPIACGTPEQIQCDPAVIEAYLGSQDDAKPLRDRAHEPRHAGDHAPHDRGDGGGVA